MPGQRQRRPPAAATPPPAGDVEVRVEAPTAVERIRPTDVEQLRAEVADLRTQLKETRDQVDEITAIFGRRIDRHRRRIEHPRIGPQPATD